MTHCLYVAETPDPSRRWHAHPCVDVEEMRAVRTLLEQRLGTDVRMVGAYDLLDDLLEVKNRADPIAPGPLTH